MDLKPKTYKRLIVQKLTANFREAVSIETIEICLPKKGELCVKNKYVGINGSDVNATKGRYFISSKTPFGVGMEAVGEIVEVGDCVENFKIGDCVAYVNGRINSYSEYTCISAESVFIVPEAIPKYLGLLVSGLTATIGLDKVARIMAGETILITAAAGGVGHIAVQWAKIAGCYVIGTCSTEEKENILKDLGCDRVINYEKENIAAVLSKEYPKGVNVVWETIGGRMFDDCLKNLSIKGRIVVVGEISEYKTENEVGQTKTDLSGLLEQLLFKSEALMGFFVPSYHNFFPSYSKLLSEKIDSGSLKFLTDNGETSTGTEFFGLEGIIRGIEHLFTRKSIGKVIARLY